MNLAMYAILDIVSQTIVGNIISLHRHPAAAIRMFIDAAQDKRTAIGQHPADHNLVCLGYLNDLHEVVGKNTLERTEHPHALLATEVILTGKAWLASLESTPQLVKQEA